MRNIENKLQNHSLTEILYTILTSCPETGQHNRTWVQVIWRKRTRNSFPKHTKCNDLTTQITKKRKKVEHPKAMATINHLLFFLLTITVLLTSKPCLTIADLKNNYKPSPKPSNCAQYNQTDLKIRFLAQHNLARKQVNIPKLVWDKAVANYSRWYARQRWSDCRLIHSHGYYGENLFWGSGNCWKVEEIVQAWVVERKDYDYQTNSCRKVCGHYTQIVWKNTTKLGCAVVVCNGDQGTLSVCNYDPPGNYVGMLPY
jgi:uncharacterized protein YkwD